jgi:acetyl esterase/lipase
MQNVVQIAKVLWRPAILVATAALVWSAGASIPAVGTWLLLAGGALAMDRAGGRRFVVGLAAATLFAGLWMGVQNVDAMQRQVPLMLLGEFLPNLPTLTRPIAATLGLWTCLAAFACVFVRIRGTREWRRSFIEVGCAVALFAGFFYAMLFAWPDPAYTQQRGFALPLGVSEVFFYEHPQADLSDVVDAPERPPAREFDLRKALSYGPHGYRNTLDLYSPRGVEGPTPVVIYVHGGGAMGGGTDADQNLGLPHDWRDALLARGIAVANINYRLVYADPSSPHEEVTGPCPAQIQDCLAVVRFLRAEHSSLGLDPKRIGMMGHSFGGYLSSLAGLCWDRPEFITDTRREVSSRMQAVVNSAGITDLRTYGSQVRWWAKEWNLPTADYLDADDFIRKYCDSGDALDRDSATIVAASPLLQVRRDASPSLLIYGYRDLAIQGEMLHMRLKKAGASSRLIIIPGAAHNLASVAGTGDVMADFLDRELRK